MRTALLVATLLATPAWAAVPRVLAHEGRILRADGTPERGSLQLTFALYNAASGGASIWSESQSVSLGGDGYYATLLGRTAPLPALDGSLFLGITVQGESEMAPRAQIGAAPYALRAAQSDDADKLGGDASTAILRVWSPVAPSQVTGLASIQASCPAGQVVVGYGAGFAPLCGPANPALLQWTAASLDFGTVTTTDVTRAATLANLGSAAATGVTIFAPAGFSVTTSCTATLSAGASCGSTFTMPAGGLAGARTAIGAATSSSGGSSSLLLSGTYAPPIPNGSADVSAAPSCNAIKTTYPASIDGLYWLDGDGVGPFPPFQTYCDMTTEFGGWTMVMGVVPNDGGLVDWFNTTFWQGDVPYGTLAERFTRDFKSPAAYLVQGTKVMIQVANQGATGTVIGWKWWSMLTRTFDLFFSDPFNTVQTTAVGNFDVTNVYAWEPLLRNGVQLMSNRNDNPNGDLTRLATTARPFAADDNQPGLGTAMNGINYPPPALHRSADVELQWGTTVNIWCTAPSGPGTYKWIGSDLGSGSNTGACNTTAGPGYAPAWNYRIFVK